MTCKICAHHPDLKSAGVLISTSSICTWVCICRRHADLGNDSSRWWIPQRFVADMTCWVSKWASVWSLVSCFWFCEGFLSIPVKKTSSVSPCLNINIFAYIYIYIYIYIFVLCGGSLVTKLCQTLMTSYDIMFVLFL